TVPSTTLCRSLAGRGPPARDAARIAAGALPKQRAELRAHDGDAPFRRSALLPPETDLTGVAEQLGASQVGAVRKVYGNGVSNALGRRLDEPELELHAVCRKAPRERHAEQHARGGFSPPPAPRASAASPARTTARRRARRRDGPDKACRSGSC